MNGKFVALYESLQARFGERFSQARAIRDQHAHGESYHDGQLPDGVVRAQSTQDVADVARLCAEYGCPLIPFGAGTSLEGQLIAVHGGISLDLTDMNRVLRVSVADLDCTVEAGVTREQLNLFLRDQGVFFPVDPGANASIGGMAATRASGTNAVRYGTMRENVLGLTVVLPGGQIVQTGNRARKSSAGYDLTRLFVGSEGTLGIITDVTIRLFGIPETVVAARCSFAELSQAIEAAIAIMQLGIPVARMELMDRGLVAAINRHSALDLAVEDTLVFEFHGSPTTTAEQVALVREIVDQSGARSFEAATSPEERNRIWKARYDAFYAVVAQRPGAKGWSSDVCVPISELTGCIEHARELIATCPVPAAILGHVGDGNFHVVFAVNPNQAEEMAAVQEINGEMVRRSISVGGTCTGEHGIGLGKMRYLREEAGGGVDLMAALKAALDPHNIMNPGKIFATDQGYRGHVVA